MMRSQVARELEDWIGRTFHDERAVTRNEVLRRAADAQLPSEEMVLLEKLPQASRTRTELMDEIERMTGFSEPGGSAGGMDAGSSGEMRPGAYGAPPSRRYGGDEGSSYEP